MKEKFNWDDREDHRTFIPCDFCNATSCYPVDEHGNSLACEHCDYNITLYCLEHDV